MTSGANADPAPAAYRQPTHVLSRRAGCRLRERCCSTCCRRSWRPPEFPRTLSLEKHVAADSNTCGCERRVPRS